MVESMASIESAALAFDAPVFAATRSTSSDLVMGSFLRFRAGAGPNFILAPGPGAV